MDRQRFESRTDEDLLAEFARTKSAHLLDELVRRHYGRVLTGANAVLRDRDEAADVAQETFVRVVENAENFRGGSFRGWLYTVSRRLSLDALLHRRPTVELDENTPSFTDDAVDRLAEVEQILGQLSRPQRICLQLFHGRGMTFREIADLTQYSEKAVKSYIQNGRSRFKRLWERRAGQ